MLSDIEKQAIEAKQRGSNPAIYGAIKEDGRPASQWKCGPGFMPYHPSASHIPPEYRDGWNACYAEATRAPAARPSTMPIAHLTIDQDGRAEVDLYTRNLRSVEFDVWLDCAPAAETVSEAMLDAACSVLAKFYVDELLDDDGNGIDRDRDIMRAALVAAMEARK